MKENPYQSGVSDYGCTGRKRESDPGAGPSMRHRGREGGVRSRKAPGKSAQGAEKKKLLSVSSRCGQNSAKRNSEKGTVNHIPRSLFEIGAEKSRPAVWMVLAVKCKKTAEDENIFVGGSDENDSESDLLAREKRGGLEQRGQRRSDLGRENVTFENGRIIGIQLFYCKGLKPINCEVADCDLDFERSEIRGAITTPGVPHEESSVRAGSPFRTREWAACPLPQILSFTAGRFFPVALGSSRDPKEKGICRWSSCSIKFRYQSYAFAEFV